jgi:hypothetical protein
MATGSRVIRVFVSSTFRDMQEEREELIKHIFPQLRKLCESRGVVWGEVDLRWGITDEATAEGKVLPICLEEIKRCRPYFIGLLGERYGWVPEEIPPGPHGPGALAPGTSPAVGDGTGNSPTRRWRTTPFSILGTLLTWTASLRIYGLIFCLRTRQPRPN